MKKAQKGDAVRVHFSACLDDGTTFATTHGEKPMELTIGERKLISCFEQSIVGMEEGERKKVSIEPNQAVGEVRPELISQVPRDEVPEQYEDLAIGGKVEIEQSNGKHVVGTVTQLTDQTVTIDANHPLAGETLLFDITLVEFA